MLESTFNTKNNVNTVLGLVNQLTAQMNASFTPRLNTTINSKRNVQPLLLPENNPTLRYFGIGIKGFHNINDSTLAQPYLASVENMDLYEPIPFRCVPVAQDLDDVTRLQYRMRTRETFDGDDYFCYWLKVIDFPDTAIDVTEVNLLTNVETPYDFSPSNLTPTPVPTDGIDTIDDATSKIIVSMDGVVEVTGAEIAEAIEIIHGGDYRLARISEFGFYTGEDQTVEALDQNSVGFDMTEAIYVQLATHRTSLGHSLEDPASVLTESIVYRSMDSLVFV